MSEISTIALFDSLQILKAYEQAIDANIICSITDISGNIVHANHKFCEISKYTSSEVMGQKHSIINSGYHPKEFFLDMWRTISQGKVWHHEIKNKAKDGSYYWVDTVIVPIKDEGFKVTHYLSLRTLISKRKELEEKKEKYLTSLEVLLVMTSNTVKKPLADCLQQINHLDQKESNKKELVQIAGNIKQSILELQNSVNDLSVFIREMEK